MFIKLSKTPNISLLEFWEFGILEFPSEEENSKIPNSQNSNNEILGVLDNLININTASQSELESLWGIGPVYAQNIIEQRPYSSVEELLTKKIIKQNVYDRVKDQISVY